MMLTKAKLSGVCDGKPGVSPFYVQFNPNEISISEAVASLYNKSSTKQQLNPVETQTSKQTLHLSMTLFYNTYTSLSQDQYEDVRGYIRKLYPYTNIGMEEKRDMKKICFEWSSICVIGILDKVDVRYTMFSPAGTPIRAEVSISIAGAYYGDQSLASMDNIAQAVIDTHTSFFDALRTFQDPSDWKTYARSLQIKKARL